MISIFAILTKDVFDGKVQEILSRPEYLPLHNQIQDLYERYKEEVARAIVEWLMKVFSNVSFSEPTVSGATNLIAVITIVVLVALALMAVGMVMRVVERRPKLRSILGEEISTHTTPDSLREKAQTFYRAADYRMALRYDFIALLLKLHEARYVFLEETWTNQELHDHLQSRNFNHIEILKVLMIGFNAAWYGHKDCSSKDYEAWLQEYTVVWKGVEPREI